ncbi:MAG: cobalamin-binding protein [Dehalococcoidia bacterium]
MRIASLLPSATEIVYALGLGDQLVAVTHECDFPPDAATKQHVTRNLLAADLSSAEIDRAVLESSRDEHSIYQLDIDALVALRPDLILTQQICEVCAVPRSAVEGAAQRIDPPPQVLSLDPASLDDVIENIEAVGRSTGRESPARSYVAGLRDRLDAVRAAVGDPAQRPRVVCCEWLDPLYCAGHWVPEQVRIAGGEDGLGRDAQPSRVVEWRDVLDYAPEVLVLMPCGFAAEQAAARIADLAARTGWATLPAVATGQVFAVDGSAYFSRPGPRLVEGVELLARILHPESYAGRMAAGAALKLAAGGDWHFEPYR